MSRLTLTLACLGLFALPAAAQTAPKRYALLVGVNHYEHPKLPPLQYAVNDATELAAALKAYDTTLLTDDTETKPTKANVDAAVKGVLGKCKRGDIVVVALAGHGVQFAETKDAYFCPSDARPSVNGKDSLVSLTKLYADLDDSFAGVKVLLVDACRDDPDMTRGARGVDADTTPRPPRGVAALFSCSAGERAFEHESLKHGVFFHHVLKGLGGEAKNKRGEVTFNTLADYVSTHVAEAVPKVIGDGARQSPNQKADLSGTSPVLVVLAPDAVTPPMPVAEERGKPELERGLNLYLGRGVQADVAKATPHFLAAAEAGNAEAMVYLAVAHDRGYGVPIKFENVKHWLRKGAEAGHPLAQARYLYRVHDRGTKAPDYAEAAVANVRKLAEAGHPTAMLVLSELHSTSRVPGIKSDKKEQVRWLQSAAEAGEPQAMTLLGGDYTQSGYDYTWLVAADGDRALHWLRRAAEAGDPDGFAALGMCYYFGTGTPKDPKLALTWYRKLADTGSGHGMWLVGNMLRDLYSDEEPGVGEFDSLEWFRRAAQAGDSAGMYEYANAVEHGYGVQKDLPTAIEWYKQAAKYGNESAKLRLQRLGVEP